MATASPTAIARMLADKPPVQLSVAGLGVTYRTARGPLYAVDRISFEVPPGAALGLVGESGCGKSTVVKALMRLLPEDAVTTGQALLDGQDLLPMSERKLRRVRWTKIALVTQSAMNSLDPVYRVGDQIVESIRAHLNVSRAAAWERAAELFALVGLPAARLRRN
jgi:ABC-type glutathione transport system ATPase component